MKIRVVLIMIIAFAVASAYGVLFNVFKEIDYEIRNP